MSDYAIKTGVEQAYHRIKSYIRHTPLIKAYALSDMLGVNIYFKLENIQITGAFKVRGAFNKLLAMDEALRNKGVITASSGNHGAAVSYAGSRLGIGAMVFVPKTAAENKLKTIRLFGADIEYLGDEAGATEAGAAEYAKQHGLEYISPYNDIDVVCGQGTIAYELQQQLDRIDEVYVAVGGGGLISGIAGYLKAVHPQTKIIACQPENSPVMYASIQAGRMIAIEIKPTLSDATAGNNDLDAITFDFCKKYVDDYVLVSEAEIKQALCLMIEKEHVLGEGAAAVAMAAALKNKSHNKDKNIVIVICGGNISMSTLQKVICPCR